MGVRGALFAASLLLLCIVQGDCAQRCGLSDISVKQTKTGKIVEGVPEYEVVVSNNCLCPQASVVLQCPGFGSIEPVDPKLLKPLGEGMCSLNSGKPVKQGFPIKFQYAWLTPYDLIPKSSAITCH